MIRAGIFHGPIDGAAWEWATRERGRWWLVAIVEAMQLAADAGRVLRSLALADHTSGGRRPMSYHKPSDPRCIREMKYKELLQIARDKHTVWTVQDVLDELQRRDNLRFQKWGFALSVVAVTVSIIVAIFSWWPA